MSQLQDHRRPSWDTTPHTLTIQTVQKMMEVLQRQYLERMVAGRFSQDELKFVFRETADEHPDAATGDVILLLQEQEHSVFDRNELFLVEALCGWELEITHLDGWKLQVTTSPGEIVQPMMQKLEPFENGDVFRSRSASSSL